MTDKEKRDFIVKVEEKKIHQSNWTDTEYTIPNGDWIHDRFAAITYKKDGSIVKNDHWPFLSGLSKNCWEFYKEKQVVIPFKVGDMVACKPEYDKKYGTTNCSAGKMEVVGTFLKPLSGTLFIGKGEIQLKILKTGKLFENVTENHFQLADLNDSDQTSFPVNSVTKPCICPLDALLENGCTCGAIKPYKFKY